MRKNTKALFAFLVLACLALWQAPSAQAQLIVYEGYDYPEATSFPETDGSLDGGIGWDGGWRTRNLQTQEYPSNQTNNAQAIVTNGMSYTDSQGNRLQTMGGALDATHWSVGGAGNNQGIPEREIDTSVGSPAELAGLVNPSGSLGKIGTTLWMSILMEGRDEFVPDIDNTSNGVGTRDLNIGGANRSIYFGRPVALKLDGTQPTEFFPDSGDPNEAYGIGRNNDGVIRLNPGDATQPTMGSGVPAGIDLNSGVGATAEKVFMVLKLDFKGQFDEIAEVEFGLAPGDYGTNVSAWINPDLDADLANDPQGAKSGINFADEVNYWQISFNLMIPGFGNADTTFDEFRIGATYADVAPIDTSVGLAGDFDVDGDVDGADFLLWQRDTGVGSLSDWETNFGASAGVAATSAVPEPSSVMLVSMALAGFAVRRRR